ncbi:hypothetical protein C4D60_Mb08t09000 [Musa balbisiana]|uniref:Response regulatory domain-containing protein n=1 Tax=Musa balbisiana TaxID=52838 RepID=A0A4S8K2E2_MUSBA|nr:hypothetical protein C4D60_Mb08t09000 [Musa balbisiana]
MGVDPEAQFHVLAVDDSLIDRKLIERLLRTSSYRVTTVDSGSKALEVLGLMEDQDVSSPASTDKNGSSNLKGIPVVIMSSENVPSRINRLVRHLFLWSYFGRNQDKGFLCQQSQTSKIFSL